MPRIFPPVVLVISQVAENYLRDDGLVLRLCEGMVMLDDLISQ